MKSPATPRFITTGAVLVAFGMAATSAHANTAESAAEFANPAAAEIGLTGFTLASANTAAVNIEGLQDSPQDAPPEGTAPQGAPQGTSQGQPGAPGGPPPFAMPDIVFDDNWVSVGIGAGLVPSYSGSDDYIVFPLPLIVGSVGGIGIRPNGPGIRLDLVSPEIVIGSGQKAVINFGPAVRFRNDRANQIQDDVVELAEDLDVALEVGAAGGVTFPGVFNRLDSLTFNTQVRWDVLGAHDGMLIEPTIGYIRPIGRGIQLQSSFGLQFADDSFADYYYTVTPEQSADTGLPLFNADGGLNAVSATMILNFDLDGNVLNGGLSIYTVTGYTRLVGDAANTPFTSIRGDADQFIGGVGVAYTF